MHQSAYRGTLDYDETQPNRHSRMRSGTGGKAMLDGCLTISVLTRMTTPLGKGPLRATAQASVSLRQLVLIPYRADAGRRTE